ncbi:MAG: DUF4180 domain-containing protein [Pseudonocardia sp.]
MTTPRVHRVPADGPPLADEESALTIIGDALGAGAELVTVPVARLTPDFFRLRTGVAGAVVQKFVNYRLRLVIVGDVAADGALADWVREANRGRELWFVADAAELARRLAAIHVT